MKTLYLDCGMGAAGDMLAAALLELLPEPDAFVAELNTLGIPGVRFTREPAVRCGIRGTHLRVTVHGAEEHSHDVPAAHDHPHEHVHERPHDHEHVHEHHDHEHDHGREHHHHHSSMADIETVVAALPLPAAVRADVLAVYDLIAAAESHAHGCPVGEVHFHEVGAMDAVADITAVCLLLHRLAPDRVLASPVCTGYGQVRCAHGILPVPAPATAHILQGVPIYGGRIEGELCTPTGAALLKHFVRDFGPMPVLRPLAVGYGMGQKEFPAANCLRATLGESEDGSETDTMLDLSCNVDDMTAEDIAFAMEQLFAGGAREVYTVPIGMKKSRPGTLLRVLCPPEQRDAMLALLFRHTTTLGVRETATRRYILSRRSETVQTPFGPVRRKHAEGYGVQREKWEHDDLARIAREQGLSAAEVRRLLELEED